MKFLYTLAVVLYFVTIMQAQPSAKPPKGMARCGKIVESFDKKKDERRVQLEPYLLAGAFKIDRELTAVKGHYRTDDWGFAMSFLYTYSGKETKPTQIHFLTLSEGESYRYETEKKLSFDIGSAIIELGSPSRTTGSVPFAHRLREELATVLTPEQLTQIAAAERVSLKAGRDSFELTPCQIWGLRKFAATIN